MFTIVLDELATSIIYPEDGVSKFLWNISNAIQLLHINVTQKITIWTFMTMKTLNLVTFSH
jgi:hypothetical protein